MRRFLLVWFLVFPLAMIGGEALDSPFREKSFYSLGGFPHGLLALSPR